MFSSTAVRHFLSRSSATSISTSVSASALSKAAVTLSGRRTFASVSEHFEDYGRSVFSGKVADEYLSKHGGSAALLKDPTWVNHSSDTVANAVFDWYVPACIRPKTCGCQMSETLLSAQRACSFLTTVEHTTCWWSSDLYTERSNSCPGNFIIYHFTLLQHLTLCRLFPLCIYLHSTRFFNNHINLGLWTMEPTFIATGSNPWAVPVSDTDRQVKYTI